MSVERRYALIGHTHEATSGGGTWGSITGTLSDQTDLWTVLGGKASTSHTHAWVDITGKPSTFTPSAHTHLWADLTDKPSTFTPSAHTHSTSEVTNLNTNFIWGGANNGTNSAPVTYDAYHITQYKSGFWDINGSSWAPDSGWWWGITAAHTGNTPSYNYGAQYVMNLAGTEVYFRSINNGTANAWRRIYHSSNLNNHIETTGWSFTNTSLTLSAHLYRNNPYFDTQNVYDHFYAGSGNGANITRANLRVWDGAGGYKALRFDGSGLLEWPGTFQFTNITSDANGLNIQTGKWIALLNAANNAFATLSYNTGTYGNVRITGTKTGYAGIQFSDGWNAPILMFDSAGQTHGVYRNDGVWHWYYNDGYFRTANGAYSTVITNYGNPYLTNGTAAPSGGSDGHIYFQYT